MELLVITVPLIVVVVGVIGYNLCIKDYPFLYEDCDEDDED